MTAMSELRLPLLVLALFLLPVFVPPFYEALESRWMYIGLGGGLVILFHSLTHSANGIAEKVVRFHWLFLALYTFHQFEEHGIDLFGRSYYFAPYVNQFLGYPPSLTMENILLINTVTVWLGGLIAIWGGWRYLWPGLAFAGIVLANALVHIGVALYQMEYNPGLATSILLFLPAFFFYTRLLTREGGLGLIVMLYAFLWGVVGHIALPFVMPFASEGGWAAYVVLCLLAFIPLAANLIFIRVRRA